MADICFVKGVGGVLLPSTDEDKEKMKAWKVGDVLHAQVRKPRNGRFHRKCRKLLSILFESQDQYREMRHFEHWVKLQAGWYDEIVMDGKLELVPKSTAFDAMDETDHRMYYKALLRLAASDLFLGHMTESEIDNHMNMVLDFS